MKYAWITAHRDQFQMKRMFRILQVSKGGYYESLKRKPSARVRRGEAIRRCIQQVFEESDGIYGSYKIAEELSNDDSLETACRNTIAKAMKEMGLTSCVAKKFKPTTTVSDPSKKPAPNILAQDFQASAPNQKWVSDITYLSTADGWVYLAVVMDLFSRKVVGWSISDDLSTSIVTSAFRKAVEARVPNTNELLHHSDRGCQYTSHQFQTMLKTMRVTCSMSRKGCCYDNAVMERFFWSLKKEWTNRHLYNNLKEAELSVFQYIETFYNSKRIHQTLNYKSPNQFESQLAG